MHALANASVDLLPGGSPDPATVTRPQPLDAPSLRRHLWLALLVCAGCYVGALVGAAVQFSSRGPAILFPPYAILTTALVCAPPRYWWIYLAAAALGDFVPHHSAAAASFALLTETANFTRALVAAVGVRCLDNSRGRFDTLQGMAALLLFAVALAPAAAAFVGAAVVMLYGRADGFWVAWQQWFVSNTLTGLTLLPILVISAKELPRLRLPKRSPLAAGRAALLRAAEGALLASGLLLAGMIVFAGPYAGDISSLPARLYWPLPFLLWSAVRFGPGGTCAALLAIASLTIWGALHELGPFAARTPGESVAQLQLFLVVMSVPFLLLSALMQQRVDAEVQSRQLEAQRQLALVLRESDRRKDEFLAILGHELRNPLNAMVMALDVLRRLPAPGEQTHRMQDVIGRQLSQMTRLIEDLLDVSRIGRGQIELRREAVEVAAVVEQAVQMSWPQITSRGHALTVSLPETGVRVQGDPVRLVQITANLLNNAARYTQPQGRIHVGLERHGDWIALSVRDSGIGIAPDMLAHIFEPFSRVESTSGIAHGGLGIGLTIVKRLTELHGGRVEARSIGLGRGSEFVVHLPALVEFERSEKVQRSSTA